jgi:hypothetical protein
MPVPDVGNCDLKLAAAVGLLEPLQVRPHTGTREIIENSHVSVSCGEQMMGQVAADETGPTKDHDRALLPIVHSPYL